MKWTPFWCEVLCAYGIWECSQCRKLTTVRSGFCKVLRKARKLAKEQKMKRGEGR